MAKTIKFNLICDNTPVRTLEDLQENFVIEDVLAYYNDKLLHRWLKVRGYSEELAKVEGITSSDEMDIIKELIEIFNVSVDKSKVDEEVYMLQFLAEREKLYAEYDRTHYLSKKVIEDYKNGYIELIKKIINNPSDISIIKSCIKEMVENYDWVLELNHRDLFNDLLEKSKLAVMCLLSTLSNTRSTSALCWITLQTGYTKRPFRSMPQARKEKGQKVQKGQD